MITKTIAIIGANGFLGKTTDHYFRKVGWRTVGFTRDPKAHTACTKQVPWTSGSPEKIARHLEGVDAVINLAGRSVDCRYNRKNKAEILNSRLESTRTIEKAIECCQMPPRIWLNASSATIYEEAFENPQTEKSGTLGHGFSVSICRAWENAFFESKLPNTRKVALRTSLVLGHGRNSVYPRLAQLTRMGLGGTIGDGEQMVSWIHELDFARALKFLIEDESLEGVFNLAAPAPLTNRAFMRILREKTGRAIGIPTHVPGNIWKINVAVGDHVEIGETMIIVESMKMEISIESSCSGIVDKLLCQEGASVSNGQNLCLVRTD